MLSNFGLVIGFWGEPLLTTCHILNRVPNKRINTTPYEFWKKRKPNFNLQHLKIWACRAIARVFKPKRRKLGERRIECIFLRFALNSKVNWFMVIEPNDAITFNTVIESRDAIFDKTRLTSISRAEKLVQKNILIIEC